MCFFDPFSFFNSAFCPQTPSPSPEESRSKMRRDIMSGWLPKLLFVLVPQTAHKTQYGKGPILCDGVSTLPRAPQLTDQDPFQNGNRHVKGTHLGAEFEPT